MKYLFLLLVLTACTTPKTEMDLSLEAFTNYDKYFEQNPRYPYITLEDGVLTGYDVPDFPIRFSNAGKTIIYTNRAGGLIINDEEVLLSYEEMKKIYHFSGSNWIAYDGDAISRQLSVYEDIDKYLTNEVTNIAQLSNYLDEFFANKNIYDTPIELIRFLLATYYQDIDYREMIYSNISQAREKEAFHSYFLGPQDQDLRIEKLHNLFTKLLILDTMEKTRVRMLNLTLLSIMITQPDNNRYIFIESGLYRDPYRYRTVE